MELQSNNYIPVKHLPNRSLTHEEKEITKEIIDKKKEIISNNEKMLALKPIFEKGLEWLKAHQAERSKEPSITSKASSAKAAYANSGKISTAIKQIDDVQKTPVASLQPIDKHQILKQADLILDLGDYRGALKNYNTILKNRENHPIPNDYRPIDEKLRQASKLYTEFRPIIESLDITNALKKNLFCTGISAHTQGAFALSKAEVLHMINNQFFYPA